MSSDHIFDLIERIGATSSKTEKQGLIEVNAQDPELRLVLKACYDPFITYGIAKVPERTTSGPQGAVFDGNTWGLLDQLATRQLTGNAARQAVQTEMDRLEIKSAVLLRRILIKDMRAGFTESTINKAIPGLVPTFDCALAHPFKEHKHKLKYPLIAEPKLDGVRVLAFVDADAGEAKFFSRSGKEFSSFDHLKDSLLDIVRAYRRQPGATLPSAWVFDGEVVSGSFNKTVSEVRKKDAQALDASFYVFDALTREEWDKPGSKDDVGPIYKLRRLRLLEMLTPSKGTPIKLIPAWDVETEEKIHELYEAVRAKGLEGLIIKCPNSPYYRKRHHAFSKIKAEETLDLEVISAFEGQGKYEGKLGGLVVNHKGVAVNVGGGFSDEQRDEFWKAWKVEREMGMVPPYSPLTGRLIEVQYHEVTPDGSLRHPRFVRFRDDKPLEKAA